MNNQEKKTLYIDLLKKRLKKELKKDKNTECALDMVFVYFYLSGKHDENIPIKLGQDIMKIIIEHYRTK